MAIRHYVLLATDTNQEHELQLPLAPDVCTGDRQGVYAFGFVGGLYKDDKHEIDEIRDDNFTVTIGSGESYDLLLVADDKRSQYRKYIVKGQDDFPSLCSQMVDLQDFAASHPDLVPFPPPSPIFDIPTEPVDCPPNTNTVNYVNICAGLQGEDRFFPQFYPAHNHDDYKVTNDGTYPGGQLILFQIDAPPTDNGDDGDESC